MTSNEFKIQMMPLKDKLFRFAERIVSDSDDAADIVQDAFLKLWMKKDDLSEIRNIEAFAMVTVRNLSLDRIKAASKNNVRMNDERVMSHSTSLDEHYEQKDIVEKVKQIIKGLPEIQRSVIHLRDVEELEFDEISDIMKMNLNSIRVNLSRARKSVRSTLNKIQAYEHRGI